MKASDDRTSPGFFRFLVLLMVTGICFLRAQPGVSSIVVVGPRAFSLREILDGFAIRIGKPYSVQTLQNDLRLLQKRYLQDGFLFMKIDSIHTDMSEDSASVGISVFVSEGERAAVRTIEFRGLQSVKEGDLQGELLTSVGSAFNPEVLEQDLHRILQTFERRGFPLAKVSVEEIRSERTDKGHDVHIVLVLDEGVSARITELKVEGNKTTKRDVISREVRLTEDQIYTEELGERIKRRLERLQLFSSVSRPEFYLSDKGTGGLLIRVTEGNPNRFDGILGYVPARDHDAAYVTGLVDLQFRNLFGSGRKLSARWYRENQSTQELELGYIEPWVVLLPVNGSIGFFQRKQDSTFVRQSYRGSVALMVNEELSGGLQFEQTNVFPNERVGNPVEQSRSTSFGVLIRYDSRDEPALPSSGILYQTTYEIGVKSVERRTAPAQTDDRTGKLSFDLEYFVPTFPKQVLAAALHIKDFQSTIVDQSDLFRLGGTRTLRGYRESQFAGSRLVWSNLEYRFHIGGRSAAYGFIDGGYVAVPENLASGLIKSEQTKLGYGIGMRLDTSLGLIGLSLALGEHDTLRSAKLHFRLINEF